MFKKARNKAKEAARRYIVSRDFSDITSVLVESSDVTYAVTKNMSQEDASDCIFYMFAALMHNESDFISACSHSLAVNDLDFKDCLPIYRQRADLLLAFRISGAMRKALNLITVEELESRISMNGDYLFNRYKLSFRDMISEVWEYLDIDINVTVEDLARVRKEAIDFANAEYDFIDSSAFEDSLCKSFGDFVHLYSSVEASFIFRFLNDSSEDMKDYTSSMAVYLYKIYIASKIKELFPHELSSSDGSVISDLIYRYDGMSPFEKDNTLSADELLDEIRALARG